MNGGIDILRGELERLFSLEELTSLSQELLGLNPADVGGTTAKATFARALTERCQSGHRLDALVDALVTQKTDVDPRVHDAPHAEDGQGYQPGDALGPFIVHGKVKESDLFSVYDAEKGGLPFSVTILRAAARKDESAVQRFLTAHRLVATVAHAGLPRRISVGEADGAVPFIAHERVDGTTLAARVARTGPSPLSELRPILRALLEPLAALHEAKIAHGDLSLHHAVQLAPASSLRVVLVGFGADRLVRRRFGGTLAPEIVRGGPAGARSDVYAVGAMLYELLTGKPVFAADSAADASFLHLMKDPEAPSLRAPAGWGSAEVDAFVLSLLKKSPAERPADAGAVLEILQRIGRSSLPPSLATSRLTVEELEPLVRAVLDAPENTDAAVVLEHAADDVALAARAAETFVVAASHIKDDAEGAASKKKSLLFRAARLFDVVAGDKAKAEGLYASIAALDPEDDIALIALQDVKKSLGRYDDVVEMLVARSELAAPGADRARVLVEIGKLYAEDLDDADQALVAYGSALAETPLDRDIAAAIERLAGSVAARWAEVLDGVTAAARSDALSATERGALLTLAGRWYDAKLGRSDMALFAYQELLRLDAASETAHEGLAGLHRRGQKWTELAATLLAWADASGSGPRARERRVEAAEVFEARLEDDGRAKPLLVAALAEDPAHGRAGEILARIHERAGEGAELLALLNRRAECCSESDRVGLLLEAARVAETRLGKPAEAIRRYESAVAIDPWAQEALKALERLHGRLGEPREVLAVLERQVSVAPTPRQQITLLGRIASLYEEEFLDVAKAAEALARLLIIDPTSEAAMTALARHYRTLRRWDDLVALEERRAEQTGDVGQRTEILLGRARILLDQNATERATRALDGVLAIAPAHGGALEALAELREREGDGQAALGPIESLAAKAETPAQRAEHWIRAARILEGLGERDGAVDRYKRALEASPKDERAITALKDAFLARKDIPALVALLARQLEGAESATVRVRLLTELARIHREHVRDTAMTVAFARRAIELDPAAAEAQILLADAAFDEGNLIEAARLYDGLLGRSAILSKADGARVALRFVCTYGKVHAPPSQSTVSVSGAGGFREWFAAEGPAPESAPLGPPSSTLASKLDQALSVLRETADKESFLAASEATFRHANPETARAYGDALLVRFDDELTARERASVLHRVGESARRRGDLDTAVRALSDAVTHDRTHELAPRSLARTLAARGEHEELLALLESQLDVVQDVVQAGAEGSERFNLLVAIGDLSREKLGDLTRASQRYGEALSIRENDRNVLSRLMALYSQSKDWAKLVDVVSRLADFVGDPRQRAKYLHTAAIVTSRELRATERALAFYDRALEADPTLSKARDEALELRRARGDFEEVERLLQRKLDDAKANQDRGALVRVLDDLGGLYENHLEEPELAIDAFEAALAFEPDDDARIERLAALYASNPSTYMEQAVATQGKLLARNPARADSYRALRELYTNAKQADAAWCLCQALTVMNLAEPEEERFFQRHRAESAAPAMELLTEEEWSTHVLHPDLNPSLTALFSLLEPAVRRVRSQTLDTLGYDARYAIEAERHPYPVSQTLHYARTVLGLPASPIFQNTNEPCRIGFIHAQTPAVLLGREALNLDVTPQVLAFIVGRHLTYLRPGLYLQKLVPTGTGLKAWLFGAVRMSIPNFPLATELAGPVAEAREALALHLDGPTKDRVASLVAKLVAGGGALDLKKWSAAVELTADRAGLILAHDLELAQGALGESGDVPGLPVADRAQELVLFAVSESYFAVRRRLGVTID